MLLLMLIAGCRYRTAYAEAVIAVSGEEQELSVYTLFFNGKTTAGATP